ncbi:MAG: TonB-dependent receptor, partial [Opitutaceae bacterium]|nr:TonB-dependent receptor [Opitutaceae bacterium]
EAFTDEEGNYWLGGVPAGEARLETFYTGLPAASALVQVAPGRTAQVPVLELGGAGPAPRAGTGTGVKTDDIVKLDAFVVTSSREMSGAALAVNSQRFADNTRSVVSIEEMGFTDDGSLAGALKFLPGIDLADDDTGYGNYITLSGAPSSNVPVTIGGFDAVTSSDLVQQSSPAAGGNNNQRAVNLMQISTAGISRIEVNRSPTPDSPGSALAGSVNLVPKSAFERVRPVYTFRVFGMVNQENLSSPFSRKTGPLTRKSHPVNDGESISAVIPLSKRFGVSLNFQRSTTPKSVMRTGRSVTANYNGTTGTWLDTPANPDHYMLYSHNMTDQNSTYERFSASLTADFKLTRNDTLSLSYNQGHNELLQGIRQVRWALDYRTGAFDRANSTLTTVQTVASPNNNTDILNQTQYIDSVSRNRSLSLRYRHRGRLWNAELGASQGKATRSSLDLDNGFSFTGQLMLEGTYIKLEDIQPWTVGKITASYHGVPVSPLDVQSYINTGYFLKSTDAGSIYTSLPAVRFKPQWTADRKNQLNGFLSRNLNALKSIIKVGFDYTDYERSQHFDPELGTNNSGFVYNGTDVSLLDFINHDYNRELAGGLGVMESLNLHQLADFYLANKGRFVQANSATDALTADRNNKYLNEEIVAGYVRLDSHLFRSRLQLVYGFRYEYTKNYGEGPLLNSTTSQYTPGGARASHDYGHLFPSVNANFTLFPNLILRAAYSKSIGRPDHYNIVPGVSIPNPNPAADYQTITITNPGLKPWSSDNVSVSIELYSSDMGDITLRGYRRWVKDGFTLDEAPEHIEQQVIDDYDIDRNEYSPDLRVRTFVTLPGTVVTSGLELSGRYRLDKILPAWARGLAVKFSASRSTFSGGGVNASAFTAQNFYLTPWSLGGGISLNRRWFSISLTGKWNDRRRLAYYDPVASGLYEPGTYRYQDANLRMDIDLRVSLTKHIDLFVNGRDINGYDQIYLLYGPSTPDLLKGQTKLEFDPVWTLGLTAKF